MSDGAATGDEAEYKRNVRTMILVLVLITGTILAAIVLPPLINPTREQFSSSVSVISPYGFTLNLSLNSTTPAPGGGLLVRVWLNSTARQILNVSSADSWPKNWPPSLACGGLPPVNVAVFRGYYTVENLSLGRAYPLAVASSGCTDTKVAYFLFLPLRPLALVRFLNSTTAHQMQLAYSLTPRGYLDSGSAQPFSGVVTVAAATEWGDLVVSHIDVTSR